MKVEKLTQSEMVEKLKNGIPFTFSRYGDGEWLTILGFYGKRNSNGCTFTRALSEDLRGVLRRKNPYFHAILKIAKRERPVEYGGKTVPYGGSVIDKFLVDNSLQDIVWYDGDVLLNDCLEGKLFPLIQQVRQRRVLYIGNKRLRGLNMRNAGFFPYSCYIEIPPTNSHEHKARILGEVFTAVARYSIDFIGWSSGLAGKVFIDETFMKYPNITQIDFGSMFDGFFEPMEHVNKAGSRSYIRKGQYDWQYLKRVNTGVE